MRSPSGTTVATVLVLAWAVSCSAPAFSQERGTAAEKPAGKGQDSPPAKYPKGFQAADVQALNENKFVITADTYKQIFDPYIASDLPVFVSTDSLLCGYHVLFEESVARLERANVPRLRAILLFIQKGLKGADGKADQERKRLAVPFGRAQTIIGVALALIGEDVSQFDPATRRLIAAEVKRITAADSRQKPQWLGPPDPGFMEIDYSRYKPRGLYTGTEDLQRYFRAVAWLQSIPFRPDHPDELRTFLVLARACQAMKDSDEETFTMWRDYQGVFKELAGKSDDLSLHNVAQNLNVNEALASKDLEEVPKELRDLKESYDSYSDEVMAMDELKLYDSETDEDDAGEKINSADEENEPDAADDAAPAVNDQAAFPPGDPAVAVQVSLRILPSARLPDAVLFQRTTDPRRLMRSLPNGLEICAALGSPLARTLLEQESGQVVTIIDESQAAFAVTSLYADYLRTLAALLDEAEPAAPEFLSGPAWQAKSCQTVLAGWAQLRHTWSLQAKQNTGFFGGHRMPAGFVEPEPEFFARLARLVERSARLLDEAGAFAPDRRALAHLLRDAANNYTVHGLANPRKLDMNALSCRLLIDGLAIDAPEDTPEFTAQVVERFEKLADELEAGTLPLDSPVGQTLLHSHVEIRPLWYDLALLCRKLESLAHKQLRRIPFSEEENGFFRGYGAELAHAMLYESNSYLAPKDDAPRITDVYSSPQLGEYHVGIGRPRAIYVLYPTEEGEVLCRGAVSSYYEFTHDARLTDLEWQGLLDSAPPEMPTWLKAIVRPVRTLPAKDDKAVEDEDESQ